MKITRRISAVVLSVVMILSMMPVMAFAEDDNAAAEPTAAEEIAVEDTAADTAEDGAEDTAEDTDAVEPEGQVTEESGEAGDSGEVIEEGSDVDEEAVPEEEAEDPEEEADDEVYDESDMGFGEASFGAGIEAEDVDATEPEKQVEDFLFSEDEEEDQDGRAPSRLLSVKGDRLTGNDLKYYNYYKKIIKGVVAGDRTNAYITVKASTFLGKRTFTASQLGVKKIGYWKDGDWHITEAAQKKINALYDPINWKRVYTSVLSDMPNSTYWVDWYASDRFFDWECKYKYNATKLVFNEDESMLQFRLPVMPEFAKDADDSYVYIFKVSQSKLAAAKQAKINARKIVNRFSTEVNTSGKARAWVDREKLRYYCKKIAELTDYDKEIAQNTNLGRTTPWSFVSVLDGNKNTLAVCAGYARAFKYLCDLSKFNSNWIDCQLVSGKVGSVGHMWNIVRMNDGLNYVVDPTWLDDGSNIDPKYTWFLRGDPNGTANSYTIDGSKRVYDEWTKATFPAGERTLAKKSRYTIKKKSRSISLKRPTIYTPLRGRKKLTVKWKRVTSHLGALYVDGYQIRYSTKKSMSNAKKIKVKGYNKKSKLIKNLKAKKYYYVQVRTYAKLGGKTYYSKWSKKKKVRTR